MKKNKYIKPATGVVNVQTYGRMLAGSNDNWADSKSHKKGLWDDDTDEYDESANSNWAGYQKYSPLW